MFVKTVDSILREHWLEANILSDSLSHSQYHFLFSLSSTASPPERLARNVRWNRGAAFLLFNPNLSLFSPLFYFFLDEEETALCYNRSSFCVFFFSLFFFFKNHLCRVRKMTKLSFQAIHWFFFFCLFLFYFFHLLSFPSFFLYFL